MGKIIIPKPNEQERKDFEKGSITLIESLTEEGFLKMAAEYLDAHNVLHLNTYHNIY
jgi:hypothetical protein